MRAVLQRVKEASVTIGGQTVGRIVQGLLIFLGVAQGDTTDDADILAQKIVQLRIFEDAQGKMNRSALEMQASLLVVSQFTLLGDCSKGRRPSFDTAAEPLEAERLYEHFVAQLRCHPLQVETGRFRAMMEVALVNDGPVTFILDSQKS